ncbi:MAG: DUF2271 domain-containing protein [Candidatus Cloacimonetes bacterium]|nr:DUF2271 domain-containing protein [Candidatus Cloacimonadota bacterium]
MKKILIIIMLAISTLMFALNQDNFIPNDGILAIEERTPGDFTITVRTSSNGGAYAPRHCFAMWITTDQNVFVKTVERKALSYMQHLVKWMQMTGGNSIGAVTGASLNTHINHSVTWNGQNYSGVDMPNGTYRVYIEFTENNSANGGIADGPWTMLEFEKGNSGYSNTYPNATYFSNMSVSYTPILPVTILSFTAESTQTNIRLSWTADENGLVGYNIYRNNTDNINTATMITSNMVPATNSDVPVAYNFVDNDVIEQNTYYYWLEALDTDAASFTFGPINTVYIPLANDENVLNPVIEDAFNYPNPFNPETIIRFSLNDKSKATVKIYNTRGQYIQTLCDKEFPAGPNELVFSAENLASGVYFYSIQAESVLLWRTMVLIK